MFSGQSFLHRLSVVLGSGPDRTTSHFLIKTILISFLMYYTECSLTKLFLYSRSLHYYFFISILRFINIYCSRVTVCQPIVLSLKRIYITKPHSFIQSFFIFYSASSSPLLLRGAPDYSIHFVSELTHQSIQRCQ